MPLTAFQLLFWLVFAMLLKQLKQRQVAVKTVAGAKEEGAR